jgi:hypothetical protein
MPAETVFHEDPLYFLEGKFPEAPFHSKDRDRSDQSEKNTDQSEKKKLFVSVLTAPRLTSTSSTPSSPCSPLCLVLLLLLLPL